MAAGVIRNFFVQAPARAYFPLLFQHSPRKEDDGEAEEKLREKPEEREDDGEEDEESEAQEEEEEEGEEDDDEEGQEEESLSDEAPAEVKVKEKKTGE